MKMKSKFFRNNDGTYEGASKSLCTNAITFNGIRYGTKNLSCVKPICGKVNGLKVFQHYELMFT